MAYIYDVYLNPINEANEIYSVYSTQLYHFPKKHTVYLAWLNKAINIYIVFFNHLNEVNKIYDVYKKYFYQGIIINGQF